MYLAWTRDVPGVPFPPVLAVPGRRTAVVCKPFSPSCAARVWEAGGGCVLRADAVPALVRDAAQAALVRGEHVGCRCYVCSRGSAARRARRGAGGGSTGTGKTWQPTGNGFASHGPAGSRPVRSAGLRRPASLPEGRPPAGFRGWAGNGQQNWQTV
jgi:hypothetical protein